MSWAEEDWTVGLSGRVLQKVKELQIHQERLSRENKQKQLQLDNIHATHEKQTAKYEEVRAELQSLHRELQCVQKQNMVVATNSERLSQELQTKQAQVCSLEGQLDAAHTLSNKLTQEVKRLEAELEKLQNSSRLQDTSLFSTPCWNTTSPWEHNESRKEERQRRQDEGKNRAHDSRQRLQFSDMPTASLPRQQNKSTPHRHPCDQSDSFSTPLAVFPWERDDSRAAARRQSPSSPQTPSADAISQGQSELGPLEKDPRTQADKSLQQLQSHVSSLEEEMCTKAEMLKSIQNDLVLSKKKVTATELSLVRARDELSLAHTRIAQESERTSGAEQRVKQLQEELKCQRQNAESSRMQHQQRSKELEKQYQRDLTELQKERQCLEKQHQQEVNKLNQELQQARTLHNALQAQADKLSLQKQALDKELDSIREKLKWTEGQLQDSQKKEAQTQAKLTEVMREAEGVAISLEQSRKRERALEEARRTLEEERADALRLLNELQEQNTAPAAPIQPIHYCPGGQSFSPQPSVSRQLRTSTTTKTPTAHRADQRRGKEEEARQEEQQRAEITASYPTDREPGEGIDAEQITVLVSSDSECLHKQRHRGRNVDEDKTENEVVECDSSGTNRSSTFHFTDGDKCSSMLSEVKTPSSMAEKFMPSDALQRENAVLRSELHDVREELQRRLEDLEAQRRAEAEARTRLKQLSRKHASQAVEKEDQEKEWRAQLECERAEIERLKKALGALESEMMKGREDIEKKKIDDQEQDGVKNAPEDRENEMIQLNIQLKQELAEVKIQLALEQEGREREEQEWNQITKNERGVKMELSLKLAEVQAELEELKRSRNEDSLDEQKLSANSPVTYLTLHHDELNCNKLLPSPEQHLLFCQSTNQRNTLVSQATSDLIQEELTVIDSEGQTGHAVSDSTDTTSQNELDKRKPLSNYQKRENTIFELTKEIEQLRSENARQTQRANQCHDKLKALQKQVTNQTKQLTMGFEKQSQHITELIAELQEKESALLGQVEELKLCRQELNALKAEKEGEEEMMVKEMDSKGQIEDRQERKRQDEKSLDSSKLQPNQENKMAAPLLTTNSLTDSNAQTDADQPETVTSDAEKKSISKEMGNASVLSETLHQVSVDSEEPQSNLSSGFVKRETECGPVGRSADVVRQLFTLQHENHLLKQRIESLMISNTSHLALRTQSDNQDPVKQDQSTGSSDLNTRAARTQQSLMRTMMTNEEGPDFEREDEWMVGTAKEPETASQHQINLLQQQVVSLLKQLHTLSEESQQQAEELAVWRLASQPASSFDQIHPDTDQISSQILMGQTHIQALKKPAPLGVPQSSCHVSVIRDDEVFLSCTSNKLHGRMLFTRLQQNNVSEPSLYPSRNTSAREDNSQHVADTDKESEKENQDICLFKPSDTCPAQYKDKRDTELITTSNEKTSQQPTTKDPKKTSTCQIRPTECLMGHPDAKPNEINITTDSSVRDVRKTGMRNVSSQTETSLYPCRSLNASELHCAYTQTEEDEDEDLVDSPPISPVPPSEEEARDKILFSGSFPIPADPARLAERIRRNRTQLSAAYDDTEYEPYGLPEVVMKGFADIPTGPSCPYIVRRGLLGTAVVPVSQKDPVQEEETD